MEEARQKENTSSHEALHKSPSAEDIHDLIIKDAESELSRPSAQLFWSGLAAGLSMGFSMAAEGMLKAYLPAEKWSPLVSNFGYSLGFLIVILGKQQLFTENTLTPVLPLLHRKDLSTFLNVLRLWGLVLIANLLGTLAFALVAEKTSVFEPHVKQAFLELGQQAMKPDFGTTLIRGIFAGWLIALMVWLLPYAQTARVWVIIFISYIIGVGHFSHVIAGSAETFTMAVVGKVSWWEVLGRYTLPTLLGNIAGGVIMVAALNHAQIQRKNTQ